MARDELVPLSEARVKIHEIIRRLPDHNVMLLRHGRPVAVMVDPKRFDQLIDRIEDLEDHLSVVEARNETPDMEVPWEKVKAEAGII